MKINTFTPTQPPQQSFGAKKPPMPNADLVLSSLKMAGGIARRYHLGRLELPDAFQAACLGLVEAAHRFDTRIGKNFEAFASVRVKGKVLDALTFETRTIRLSKGVVRFMVRVSHAVEALLKERHRQPTEKELAVRIGLSVEELRKGLKNILDYVELDSKSGRRVVDSYAHTALRDAETRIALHKAVTKLDEREAKILELHFGDKPLNLKEIGGKMGISESRVSQLMKRALGKLRKEFEGEID